MTAVGMWLPFIKEATKIHIIFIIFVKNSSMGSKISGDLLNFVRKPY